MMINTQLGAGNRPKRKTSRNGTSEKMMLTKKKLKGKNYTRLKKLEAWRLKLNKG